MGSRNSTAETAMCAILHQLFDSHEDLLDHSVKGKSVVDYMARNAGAQSERKLEIFWDILEDATLHDQPGNLSVVCVLDALD
jgi:hypothetical protein